MRFIVVDSRSGRARSFNTNGFVLGLALVGLVGIPVVAGYFSYQHGLADAALNEQMIGRWREILGDQSLNIETARQDAEYNLEASALRLAKLQARIVRLDALGERLTTVAKLDEGEFDFSRAPALGGPENAVSDPAYNPPGFMKVLGDLADEVENREQQLGVLERLLVDRKMQNDIFVAGRPVHKGWMSSRYGWRNDPINGRRAWHNGLDFAGKEGAEVISVAAGVVVFSAERSGYGNMVEINHGGGFSTRYGHHDTLLVKVGDIVKKGQAVGTIGNSGRSTGPHVHFEVFKNGRVVDPSTYVHRASR